MTVEALEDTPSTNLHARERAAAGAPHLTLIWAKRQTAGRGRRGRRWISEEGNVYWSMIVRPSAGWGSVTELPYVTALAVHAAVRPHVPATKAVTLKWPNDVLIDGAKTSGALLEAIGIRRDGAGALTADAVIVGVGINVTHHPVDEMLYPTTSLAAGAMVDRDHVLGDLTTAFVTALDLWIAHGFPEVRRLYLERAHGLKQRIAVRTTQPDETIAGVFEEIDPQGLLVLGLEDGTRRAVSTGDVFFAS